MSSKSTPTRYGSVAIIIHWASAAAVVLAFIAGTVLGNAAEEPAGLVIAHAVLGVAVFALTLLRIVWWLVADKHPAPPADQPAWQRRTANIVHALLYVLLVLMATSGIATLAASGAFPALLGGAPLPDFDSVPPRIAHGLMSRVLLALFLIHVGAALYHHFIRRDRLLARMGIGAA